jgi:hypothetical protein
MGSGGASGGDGGGGVQPPSNRVQVVVRVRPTLGPDEAGHAPAVTVDAGAARVQVLQPGQSAALDNGTGFVAKAQARAFEFDACLGPEASQADVFEACKIGEMMDSALEGYAVTVFAFGQTGAGKTHTISGSQGATRSGDGLVASALRYAYDSMASQATERAFAVRATFSEIYNETVRDLLASKSHGGEASLPIRNDRNKGFYVEGLTTHDCDTADDAIRCHSRGLSHRQVRAHNLNEQSSRSHCLLTLHVESKPAVGAGAAEGATSTSSSSDSGYRRFGKITFVDLAGSERLKQTGNTAAGAVWETGNINRSLFSLGKVISTLSGRRAGDLSSSHVPFRDSKLTQLLIDSLGGRGRSLMIACCSPATVSTEETMNTLHFASLALRVKSKPVIILDPADQLVVDLRSTINDLKSDNKRLSSQMDRLIKEGVVPASAGAASAGGSPTRGGKGGGAKNMNAYASVPGGALGNFGGGFGGNGSAFVGGVGAGAGGAKKKKKASSGSRGANVLTLGPYPDINVRSSHSDCAYGGGVGPILSLKPTKKTSSSKAGAGGGKATRGGGKNAASSAWSGANDGGSGGADSPMGGGGGGAMDFSDFPELAALEAQFQSHMAMAKTGVDPTAGSAAALESPSYAAAEAGAGAAGAAAEPPAPVTPTQAEEPAAPAAAAAAASAEPAPAPEEAAVDWAGKNKWFGRDQEMTEYAYQIHDVLVEAEGIDPSSPEYYEELDARMRDRFGDARVDGLEAAGAGAPARKKKAAGKPGTFGGGARFGGGAAAAGAGAGAGVARGGGAGGAGGGGAGTARRKPASTRPPAFTGNSSSIAERMAAQVNAEIAKKISTSSSFHGQSVLRGQSSSSSTSPSSSATRGSSPRLAPSRARGYAPPAAVSSSTLSLRDSTANQYGVSFDQQYSNQSVASSSSSNMYDRSNREGYLQRRREIIKELQMAKAEAEQEHRRLYEKIKFTLDSGPQMAFT